MNTRLTPHATRRRGLLAEDRPACPSGPLLPLPAFTRRAPAGLARGSRGGGAAAWGPSAALRTGPYGPTVALSQGARLALSEAGWGLLTLLVLALAWLA